ncbi:MAG: hypothetical protein IKP73_13660 [Bacteroidales bacterium]|nr:hypothetical protein [Bacteroidales bacterium]MBR4624328.1 hypothetical protein [Alphaproteobacteria bacterium]
MKRIVLLFILIAATTITAFAQGYYKQSVQNTFEDPAKENFNNGNYDAVTRLISQYRKGFDVSYIPAEKLMFDSGWDYFFEGEMYAKGLGRAKNCAEALKCYLNCVRKELLEDSDITSYNSHADHSHVIDNKYYRSAIKKYVNEAGCNPNNAQLQKMEQMLQKAIKSGHEHANSMYNNDKRYAAEGLGLFYEITKQYQKALDAYKKALELTSSKYVQKSIQKDIKRVEKLIK